MIKSFKFHCHKCGKEEKITAGKYKKYVVQNFQCSCRMGYPAQKLFWVSDQLVKAWKQAKKDRLTLAEPPVISTDVRHYNYSFLGRLVFGKTAFILNPLEDPQECGPDEVFIPSGFIPHQFQPPEELALFRQELGSLLYLADRWNMEIHDFLHSGTLSDDGTRHRYTIRAIETYATLKS